MLTIVLPFTLLLFSFQSTRDDLDIEVALRPRLNAPDVVQCSAVSASDKISENTIDNLFSTPNKIVIPERYQPGMTLCSYCEVNESCDVNVLDFAEDTPEPSAEEKRKRQEKVEAIKKMLSDSPNIAPNVS